VPQHLAMIKERNCFGDPPSASASRDWCVCGKSKESRAELLTFEHMGYPHFGRKNHKSWRCAE
jgi:hypothetical protein